MGQYWFYGRSLPSIPRWIIVGILFIPWLTAFIITQSKRSSFESRPFRFGLLFVICWYALATVVAEIVQFFQHLPPDGHVTIVAARIMMYFGMICFIPFIRAYILLRRGERNQNALASSDRSTNKG